MTVAVNQPTDQAPPEANRYDAFVSYSHAADGRLAPQLQAGLQRLGRGLFERRALRVFRDETGLSTNPHLWGAIEEALLGSAWFVLLASPAAAASDWVAREVEAWLAQRSVDRVLLVVTEGSIVFGSDGRLDAAATDCVPEPLVAALEAEPRWLDLRWARDEAQLDLRHARFRAAVADLAAPIHGMAKEDLEGEDVRQQRRARRLAVTGLAVVSALAVVASLTAVIAVRQRNRADEAANRALARSLAAEAAAVADADIDLALLLAVEGFRREDSLETRSALLTTLEAGRRIDRFATTLPADLWWISPTDDGSTLWVTTSDGRMQAYDSTTLDPRGEPLVDGIVNLMALDQSADGARLAFADSTAVVVVDTTDGREVARIAADNAGIDLDPTGRHLLVSDLVAGTISLVDIATSSVTATIGPAPELSGWPSAVFLADGAVLASLDGRTLVRLGTGLETTSDVPDSTDIRSLEGVSGLVVSADGSRVAVDGLNRVVLLDAETLQPAGPALTFEQGRLSGMNFDAGSEQLAVSTDDGTVRVLAAEDGTQIASFAGMAGALDTVFTSDGLLSYSIANGQSVRWRLGPAVGPGTLTPADGPIMGLVGLADGTLLSAYNTGTLTLTTAGGETTSSRRFEADEAIGLGLTVDATETRAAASVLDVDLDTRAVVGARVDVLDLPDLETVLSIPVPADIGSPRSLAFSPDGAQLAIGFAFGHLQVVDLPTGETVFGPESVEESDWTIGTVIWAPDGDRLAVGGQDGVLRFFEPGSWKLVASAPLSPGLALSGATPGPDGDTFVVASESGEVHLVSATDGTPRGEPFTAAGTQHQAAVVSGDGSTLAALSRDGTLQLWDVASRRPLGPPLSSHDGFAAALTTTLSGDFVSAGLDEWALVRWDLNPDRWIESACRRAGRQLTADEWARYIGTTAYRPTCG